MRYLRKAHICDIWALPRFCGCVAVIFGAAILQTKCMAGIGYWRVIGGQFSVIGGSNASGTLRNGGVA